MVKDIYLRPKNMKLLEENVGEILQDTDACDHLCKTPKAQALKRKLKNWLISNSEASAQQSKQSVKRHLIEWKKTLQATYPTKY